MPKLSIIIPTLNEAGALPDLLADIQRFKNKLSFSIECLVVDGGSTDQTRQICRFFRIPVIASTRGRGHQLATGARAARGDVFLFIHADSRIDKMHCETAFAVMQSATVIAGGFHLQFDDKHFILKIAERLNKIRFRCTRIFYGDHGLFIRKETYEKLGGFSAVSLFEDVDFSRRIKKSGSVRLFAPPIRTSARRFQAGGVVLTYLKMGMMHLLFWLGISPEILAGWYGKKSR